MQAFVTLHFRQTRSNDSNAIVQASAARQRAAGKIPQLAKWEKAYFWPERVVKSHLYYRVCVPETGHARSCDIPKFHDCHDSMATPMP